MEGQSVVEPEGETQEPEERVTAAVVPRRTPEQQRATMREFYASVTFDRPTPRAEAMAYQDPGAEPGEV